MAVEISSALALRPGDRVLVGLRRDDISKEEAVRVADELGAVFPGVRFVVVAGVAALAGWSAERQGTG
jgi:hypothetical protein